MGACGAQLAAGFARPSLSHRSMCRTERSTGPVPPALLSVGVESREGNRNTPMHLKRSKTLGESMVDWLPTLLAVLPGQIERSCPRMIYSLMAVSGEPRSRSTRYHHYEIYRDMNPSQSHASPFMCGKQHFPPALRWSALMNLNRPRKALILRQRWGPRRVHQGEGQ